MPIASNTLAVETPDHGWSMYRQVRAAQGFWWPQWSSKIWFGANAPPHAAPDILLLVPVAPGKKLLQPCLVSYFNLKVSIIECGCLLPHALSLLLVWPAYPPTSPLSWQMVSQCSPKGKLFPKECMYGLQMLTMNGHNFKTRAIFVKKLSGKTLWTMSVYTFMQF